MTIADGLWQRVLEVRLSNEDQQHQLIEDLRRFLLHQPLADAIATFLAMGDDLIVSTEGAMFAHVGSMQYAFGNDLFTAKRMFVDCTP